MFGYVVEEKNKVNGSQDTSLWNTRRDIFLIRDGWVDSYTLYTSGQVRIKERWKLFIETKGGKFSHKPIMGNRVKGFHYVKIDG